MSNKWIKILVENDAAAQDWMKKWADKEVTIEVVLLDYINEHSNQSIRIGVTAEGEIIGSHTRDSPKLPLWTKAKARISGGKTIIIAKGQVQPDGHQNILKIGALEEYDYADSNFVGFKNKSAIITIDTLYSCKYKADPLESLLTAELEYSSLVTVVKIGNKILGELQEESIELLKKIGKYRRGIALNAQLEIVEPCTKTLIVQVDRNSIIHSDSVILSQIVRFKGNLTINLSEIETTSLEDVLRNGQKKEALLEKLVQTEAGQFQQAIWKLLWLRANSEVKQKLINYLPKFTFNIVTLDDDGHQMSREQSTAHFFTEDLGNNTSLEMVAIPGGTFLMGSPKTELGHRECEAPQHLVTVKPFFMSKYVVTQAQWDAVAAFPQVYSPLKFNRPYITGADFPADFLQYDEVVEFCARLSRTTGRNYRLPSEAEWEYAARANTTTPFHFGKTITNDVANVYIKENSGFNSKRTRPIEITPVGSFKVANAFGLYDIHGNTPEICADHWHDNYENAPTDGSVWTLNGNGFYRVSRGGNCFDEFYYSRSASRACSPLGGRFTIRLVVAQDNQ